MNANQLSQRTNEIRDRHYGSEQQPGIHVGHEGERCDACDMIAALETAVARNWDPLGNRPLAEPTAGERLQKNVTAAAEADPHPDVPEELRFPVEDPPPDDEKKDVEAIGELLERVMAPRQPAAKLYETNEVRAIEHLSYAHGLLRGGVMATKIETKLDPQDWLADALAHLEKGMEGLGDG